jgi:hypothetical protein
MTVAICYMQITGTQTIVLMANCVFDSSDTTIWSPICQFYTLTHQWNLTILFHPGNPPFVILRNMTWRVPRVKQECEPFQSTWVHTFFSGVRIARCLVFPFFFFWSLCFCPSIYEFWLPLWYLPSLLTKYILSYS